MPLRATSDSVIRQLQIVFSASITLLIISLFASFYSMQKLIKNSELVNHTNEVLIEAENIISYVKDAETGQRGFLITGDPSFLTPYNGAYEKTATAYHKISALTFDNAAQQKHLSEVKNLYQAKFDQMERVIDIFKKNKRLNADTLTRHQEMVRGKKIMDDLRQTINRIKKEENELLQVRLEQQRVYISYTPILLVIAAVISILITAFTYIRIKNDLDERIEQQRLADEKHIETAERILVMEEFTQQVAAGSYSARTSETKEDELGRISKALNTMTGALETGFKELQNKTWLQEGTVRIEDAMRGERDLNVLANNLIAAITDYINAPLGTLYVLQHSVHYRLAGHFAATHAPEIIQAGEGLTGQAI